MSPSMMICRRRLMPGERIGESTLLEKKYLSRFSSALRASGQFSSLAFLSTTPTQRYQTPLTLNIQNHHHNPP